MAWVMVGESVSGKMLCTGTGCIETINASGTVRLATLRENKY